MYYKILLYIYIFIQLFFIALCIDEVNDILDRFELIFESEIFYYSDIFEDILSISDDLID